MNTTIPSDDAHKRVPFHDLPLKVKRGDTTLAKVYLGLLPPPCPGTIRHYDCAVRYLIAQGTLSAQAIYKHTTPKSRRMMRELHPCNRRDAKADGAHSLGILVREAGRS